MPNREVQELPFMSAGNNFLTGSLTWLPEMRCGNQLLQGKYSSSNEQKSKALSGLAEPPSGSVGCPENRNDRIPLSSPIPHFRPRGPSPLFAPTQKSTKDIVSALMVSRYCFLLPDLPPPPTLHKPPGFHGALSLTWHFSYSKQFQSYVKV
jgi:hypothetical protein